MQYETSNIKKLIRKIHTAASIAGFLLSSWKSIEDIVEGLYKAWVVLTCLKPGEPPLSVGLKGESLLKNPPFLSITLRGELDEGERSGDFDVPNSDGLGKWVDKPPGAGEMGLAGGINGCKEVAFGSVKLVRCIDLGDFGGELLLVGGEGDGNFWLTLGKTEFKVLPAGAGGVIDTVELDLDLADGDTAAVEILFDLSLAIGFKSATGVLLLLPRGDNIVFTVLAVGVDAAELIVIFKGVLTDLNR